MHGQWRTNRKQGRMPCGIAAEGQYEGQLGEGDWLRIGVASNANYLPLYICWSDGKQHIPENRKRAFPKAKIGKACVWFKRLNDFD
jgi:hypothetical protein